MRRLTPALAMAMGLAAGAAGADSHKTFAPDERVSVESVRFTNRLGIELAGDMYLPRSLDRSRRHPVIIVGHPFGGVKEQSSGLYAQELAARGFVTLAFDASYSGESGGTPRLAVSPEADVEDFSAAVDFMGTRDFTDRERIGVLGICGSGAFALSAAAVDPRMKAVATVSMYDMGRYTREGLNGALTEAQRRAFLEQIARQRWLEFEGAAPAIRFGTPEKLDDADPTRSSGVAREFFDYYRTPRGAHPNYRGTRLTSHAALANFFPFANIKAIAPRPILLIVGEQAHSRYFSDDAFARAGEPKEMLVVSGAGHVDLYDQMDKIPFDRLETFFKDNLR